MRLLYSMLLIVTSMSVYAEKSEEISPVSQKAFSVKQSVLQLNRDLYQLEEDLLSPATTQASLFFSLTGNEFFEPYSINVVIDNKSPIHYLYTERQVSALRQGAIQPLKDFNLGPGAHTIKAVVKGIDNNGKSRELVMEKEIEKNDQPLYIELNIRDKKEMQRAELIISQW